MKPNILKAGKIALFTSLAFLASNKGIGQCTTPTIYDDCSSTNSPTWTQVGSIFNFTSSRLNFDAYSGTDRRVYKQLKTSSGTPVTLSNTSWTAEFVFKISGVNGASHTLLALTAGTKNIRSEWYNDPDPEIPDHWRNTLQDGIFASLIPYGTSTNSQEPSGTNSHPFPSPGVQQYDSTHMNSTSNPTNLGWRIYGHAKNSNGNFFVNNYLTDAIAASNITSPPINHSRGISIPKLNTNYYARLERLSNNLCKISVFYDASMSKPLPGSPQCFEIDPNITGLTHMQNSAHTESNGYRRASGYVDEIKLFNNCNPTNLTTSITGNTTFCQGAGITVTGVSNVIGNTSVQNHYWEIIECDQWGNIASTPTYSYANWYSGAPGAFTFPGSTLAPCNKYYRVVLAVQNKIDCLPWIVTSQIVYVNCNPTPQISGIQDICLGSALNLCSNYLLPSSTYSLTWGHPKTNNKQCLTGTPAESGQFPYVLTVTNMQTGCSGQATAIVNVYDNNPKFSSSTSHISGTNYFTVSATVVDQTADTQPGFAYQWDVKEISPVNGPTVGGYQLCWWHYLTSPEKFPGYDGSTIVDCSTSGLPVEGHFPTFHTYKLIRTTWNQYCPAKKDSAIVTNSGNRIGNFSGGSDIDNLDKSDITIYPNPTSLDVEIKTTEIIKSISVYDINGKETKLEVKNNKIDLRNFPTGIYTLKIETQAGIKIKKIVKQD